MKPNEITEMWEADSKLDSSQLDMDAINIPTLHSKYLKILSTERVALRALAIRRKEKAVVLQDYYEGKIDGRDIGRSPWQIKESTKSAIEKRIENDHEILDLDKKAVIREENVNLLKEIINHINQRNFAIKSAIDLRRFLKGDEFWHGP